MNNLNVFVFLDSIKEVKWFSESGTLPDGCLIFDSMAAAMVEDDDTSDANWDTARVGTFRADNVLDAAHAAWSAVFTYTARSNAPRNSIMHAARDASLLAGCIAAWDDPTEVNTAYALRRWSVWTAGYGLLRDTNGMLYCYRGWK